MLKGRLLRGRRLDIMPGGVVPWHSHSDRPALLLISSGEITEYASTCAVPIVHKAGDITAEQAPTSHWWQNHGTTPVVIYAFDLFRTENKKEDKAVDKKEEAKAPKNEAASAEPAKTAQHSGAVIDADTGKPIAGVTVTVTRMVSSDWRELAVTQSLTDERGNYTFTIPSDQLRERLLYIMFDVDHPDYAPRHCGSYGYGMIVANLEAGEQPLLHQVAGQGRRGVGLRLDAQAAEVDGVDRQRRPGQHQQVIDQRRPGGRRGGRGRCGFGCGRRSYGRCCGGLGRLYGEIVDDGPDAGDLGGIGGGQRTGSLAAHRAIERCHTALHGGLDVFRAESTVARDAAMESVRQRGVVGRGL